MYFSINILKANTASITVFLGMKLYCCSQMLTSVLSQAAHQLHSSVVSTTLHVPFVFKIRTSTPLLHPIDILSLSEIVLNDLVKISTATSPRQLHTSTGISAGQTAFPLFILFNAHLTSALLMFATPWSTTVDQPLLLFFLFHFPHSSTLQRQYSFYFPITLLAPVNTFPSLSLITLTCHTSFPSLSLCLANLYDQSLLPYCPIQHTIYSTPFATSTFTLCCIFLNSCLLSLVLSLSHVFLANLFRCIHSWV